MDNITQFMTRNDCYTAGKKITPKGIMVHSTAAPGVKAVDWYARWNKSYKAGEINRQACVHAFVDNTVVVQCLPWEHRGWHAGGKANDTHIGFEICEPAGFQYNNGVMTGYDVKAQQAYFEAAYKNAVELCVFLCKKFKLSEKDIICHSEAHKLGIASNHGDVMHWFPKHGKNMELFRMDVKENLNILKKEETTDRVKNGMRYFKIVDNDMWVRQEPNGTRLIAVPVGTVISGDKLITADNGTQWLYTAYDGKTGYVAVLPESKGYCAEVTAPEGVKVDYEALYKAEQIKTAALAAENAALKKTNEQQGKELVILQAEYDQALKDIGTIKTTLRRY